MKNTSKAVLVSLERTVKVRLPKFKTLRLLKYLDTAKFHEVHRISGSAERTAG